MRLVAPLTNLTKKIALQPCTGIYGLCTVFCGLLYGFCTVFFWVFSAEILISDKPELIGCPPRQMQSGIICQATMRMRISCFSGSAVIPDKSRLIGCPLQGKCNQVFSAKQATQLVFLDSQQALWFCKWNRTCTTPLRRCDTMSKQEARTQRQITLHQQHQRLTGNPTRPRR